MEGNDSIDIAELRRLSDRLFERLERSGTLRVGVKGQYYWTVFADEAFNMEQKPDLVIGDVFDDLRDLRKEAETSDGEPLVSWHAFHHLAGLMLFVANADIHGELSAASGKEKIA